MTDQPIIAVDYGRGLVSFTEAAVALKTQALENVALIAKVSNAEQQEIAVAGQRDLRTVIKLVEDARKACKAPIIAIGKKIDAVEDAFSAELKREEMRVAKLVGDFQQLEIAKQKAAEAARKVELDAIEAERQRKLSTASSMDEADAIQKEFNDAAAALPAVEISKAEGQIVKEEWVIDSIREFELMRARPDLVRKVEFDMVALKAALSAGKLPGVTAHKVVKSSVRAGRMEVVNV
jgi:hypothetical protein